MTTASDETPKKARLEFRSTPDQKSIIERAASLMGESVTSFVLSTVLRDAVKIINNHQVTELSLADWKKFEAIIAGDEYPASPLLEAKRDYEERVSTSG